MGKSKKIGLFSVILGGIANFILGIAKLFVGLASNSIGILGDSINNLTDCASSIIGGLGIGISSKKCDELHPNGYEKAESLSAFLTSITLLLVGGYFVIFSIERFFFRQPINFNMRYFYVILTTMVVKVLLAIFYFCQNKKANSDVLKCQFLDSIMDTGITAVTLLGYGLSVVTRFPIDSFLGVAIGVIIIINGAKIVKSSFSSLVGESLGDEKTIILDLLKNHIEIIDIKLFDYGKNNSSGVVTYIFDKEQKLDIENYKKIVYDVTNIRIYFEGCEQNGKEES